MIPVDDILEATKRFERISKGIEGDPAIALAFKMLRKASIREYEVLLRALLGESLDQIAAWLNARSIRGGHPERYSLEDATTIWVAAIDKVTAWS